MTEPRQLAVVREYQEIIEVFRARAVELNISRTEIDRLCGFPSGYAAKIMGPVPIRKLGADSFGRMLQGVGLAMAIFVDPDAAAFDKQIAKTPLRKHRMPIAGADDVVVIRKTRRKYRQMARLAVKARLEKISPKKRSRLAKRASRVRWAKRRQAERRAKIAARLAKASRVAPTAPVASQSPSPND